jgi:hypothetical protein
MTIYRLYGLNLSCDFVLPAPEVHDATADVNISLEVGGPVQDESPSGELLAEISLPSANYFITEESTAFRMRFPDICDVSIARDWSSVQVSVATNALVPLAQVLVAGNILATILTLQGHCVLHGSAVEGPRGTIGFIGPPGMGKSTLAATCCESGMKLVTDDVLVVDRSEHGLSCRLGPNRLRLRESAYELLRMPIDADQTHDGRASAAFTPASGDTSLSSLVLPRPSRDAADMQVERIAESKALMELTRFPRTLGWRAPAVLESSFRWNALLARSVPIYSVTLPWGTPLTRQTIDALISL